MIAIRNPELLTSADRLRYREQVDRIEYITGIRDVGSHKIVGHRAMLRWMVWERLMQNGFTAERIAAVSGFNSQAIITGCTKLVSLVYHVPEHFSWETLLWKCYKLPDTNVVAKKHYWRELKKLNKKADL